MSLQLNRNLWKWTLKAVTRPAHLRNSVLTAVFVLLLAVSQGHSQTVGTRTALSVAADGAKTTLSVTVKDPTGAAVSTGTVSFFSNGSSLGSAIVQPDGTASLTLDKIPAATRQVSAVYSGSDRYAASDSANVALQAAASAPPDFSISASASSLSLNPGDFGTIILTVTPENGFTQSVTMTTSGLPFGTTAVFTPNIVTPVAGAAATSTLQIQTTASSKSSQLLGLPLGGSASHIAYALVFPGMLALVGIGALRKRGHGMRMLGVVLLLAFSASGLTACSQRYGYLNHPPASNTGTPAGTFPVTVTAYSNNGGEVTTHTLQITLTVK